MGNSKKRAFVCLETLDRVTLGFVLHLLGEYSIIDGLNSIGSIGLHWVLLAILVLHHALCHGPH